MKYILYCRKSQESEDRQLMSLDAQERELKEKASQLGLNVVAIYHESMSAKSIGRPVFGKVIQDIQTGKADALLCWKLDRLARNFIDGGLIIDMLQKNDIKSIQTYEKEYRPSDNVLTLAVELGMANQYSRDLSENVKRGNRQKLTQGGWPCNAPFGYLNNKVDKTLYADPIHGKHIQMIYEYYSTGLYSFAKLANKLHEVGLRSKSGNKVYKGQIQKILNNAFYHGVIEYSGKHYAGRHEPLVTREMFTRCQEVMRAGSKPRRQRHIFPLAGLLTCAECGCAITAQKQKGFHYYHCTNGKGHCSQKPNYIREEKLDEQLVTVFDQLYFDEEIIEIMYQAALERLEHEGLINTKAVSDIENQLTTLRSGEGRLLDAYVAGSIDKDVYEARQEEIKKERIALTISLNKMRQTNDNPKLTIERTKQLFLACNKAKSEYLGATSEKKREVAYELLSNALVKDKNMANIKLKSPYDILARTPKNADFSMLCTMWDDVRTCFVIKGGFGTS